MNCTSVTKQLTAYLDGELDAATASAVRGHLRLCATCRGAAEDHAVIRDTLAGLERPEAPPPVWEGVLAKLGDAEIADARRPGWSRFVDRVGRSFRPHLVPAGLAAAACATVVLVMQLRDDDQPSRAPLAVHDGSDAMGNPVAPEPVGPVPPRRPTVDATVELAAEAARIDERFRTSAAELIPLARDGKRGAALRRFDREVAMLEAAVVRADAGKARERAWHSLLTFLERAALGEPTGKVAVIP